MLSSHSGKLYLCPPRFGLSPPLPSRHVRAHIPASLGVTLFLAKSLRSGYTRRTGSVPLSSRMVVVEIFYLGCPALSCCASGPTCTLHPALGMQLFPHCSPTSLCSSLALKQPQPVRHGAWRATKSCFLCREKESPGSLRDQALCTDLQM